MKTSPFLDLLKRQKVNLGTFLLAEKQPKNYCSEIK